MASRLFFYLFIFCLAGSELQVQNYDEQQNGHNKFFSWIRSYPVVMRIPDPSNGTYLKFIPFVPCSS
jgi:hypothetical protein